MTGSCARRHIAKPAGPCLDLPPNCFDAGHWPFKVDLASFELVTMASLLVGIIVIGIWPAFILNTINATNVMILGALR